MKPPLRPGGRIALPLLVLLWAACKVAGRGSAWIEAAQSLAAHAAISLEKSSLYVTIAATFCSLLGLLLRMQGKSRRLRRIGFAAVAAPLSILLPGTGAIVFLFGVFVAAALCQPSPSAYEAWPRMLARECFGVLSAACFLLLSWQYNPQLLTRGLLVSAGVSLLGQALALSPAHKAPEAGVAEENARIKELREEAPE